MRLDAPARLALGVTDELTAVARRAFEVCECSGMARIDFFVAEDGGVVLNEINTIPGFTETSVYARLFEASGIPYPELLDRLMETRISGFTVEFARSDYDPAILKPYRDRIFVFGCIDPGNTPAPTLDSVKRKVARALEHLDPSRVLLAPDCGLMTISRALAREKLEVMVEAARGLRGV